MIRKRCDHLLGPAQVVRAFHRHSVRRVHSRVGTDAEKYLVGVGVFFAQIVHVIRSRQTHSNVSRDARKCVVEFGLVRPAMILNLDEVVVFSKDFRVPGGPLARIVQVSIQNRPADFARIAPRQADQTGRMLRQQFSIDSRAIVKALELCLRGELQETSIPDIVGREYGEMTGC